MAGHVLSEYYKNIVKATLARGCERENKALVNPDQLGRAS